MNDVTQVGGGGIQLCDPRYNGCKSFNVTEGGWVNFGLSFYVTSFMNAPYKLLKNIILLAKFLGHLLCPT